MLLHTRLPTGNIFAHTRIDGIAGRRPLRQNGSVPLGSRNHLLLKAVLSMRRLSFPVGSEGLAGKLQSIPATILPWQT